MMNKICLIGNSGLKHNDKGGQTTKLRLYHKKIKDEGFDVFFVDLEDFMHHPFLTLAKIKQGIKECDRIIFISGERACKLLIPYINRINKKYQKPFILPLVGISVLHNIIDGMSNKETLAFYNDQALDLSKQKVVKRWNKQLSFITTILPETDLLTNVFSNVFSLSNCITLNNFREDESLAIHKKDSGTILKVIFFSRVIGVKGVFELLEAVKNINQVDKKIELDVCGATAFSKTEQERFYKLLLESQSRYLEPIDSGKAVETIAKYDLFAFPTKYLGEGTPGVITESLLAGTPILTSNFPNAKYLLKDGYDSIFFEMFNEKDLEEKLRWCIANKDKLKEMSKNALESSKRFTYSYERKRFLKYVCGVDE